MESSPVEGSSQESPVMVQEESVLPDCPASSSDSTIAPSAVPNAREEQSPQVEVSTRDSPVKFNQPDFTYLEISSRPSREASCNYPMSSGQPEAPGHAGESPIEASSSIGNFPRGGDSQDIGAVMTTYDETLFREESRVASPACDFTPSRKRQSADFLPINAEIKRIGVEISEEHAKQLKNDVRRLSPILVSLRERTLGEISLTSDSGLFEDGERASDRIAESAAEGVSRSSEQSQELPIASESAGSSGLPETSLDCQDSASSSAELVSSSSSPAAKDSNLEATKHDEGPADHPKDADPSRRPGSPSTNPSAPNTPSQRSEAQRELMIVLSRVDHGSPAEGAARSEMAADRVIGNRPSDDSGVRDGTAPPLICEVASGVEKDRTNVAVECPVTGKDRQADAADSNAVLVGNVCLSPKYHDNDQLRRKSPKVVIERTLQESASLIEKPKSEHNEESLLGVNLDRVRRTLEDSLDDEDDEEDDASLSDPLAINDDTSTVPVTTASDAPESLDTETGSLIEPTSSTCPETDSLVSDETPSRDAITRLEPERPEPFTEDSAESLALASGARDEVRSDGSDSGLGSEIPGDPGTAPAPESDSETSFLDRIPDDILSDKDKVVNPLEAFVPDPGTSGIPQQQQQQHQEIHHHHQQQSQQLPLPSFPNPPKSSLKRRLTDCMEGEPSPKRINTDEPVRKKRNIQFDAVTVYYFPRAQGFTCVPSQGGSTLGMSATHTHAERFSLTEHAAEQRRLHRARLAQLRSERAANCGTEAASSSEDPSDDTDEEPSDAEELDIDSYYFLQPVPTWQRRALLRAAGIRRIDAIEKDDCRDIRASREHCGCGCKGYCDPESCPCSRANVKCQVDRAGFPCGCSRDGCANSSGRIEFNPVRVRTHFIHTLMRLQLEKKQRDEERTEHDLLMNSPLVRPMRELPGLMASPIGQMDHPNVTTGDPVACSNPNGFTSLHYDAHDQAPASSCTSGIVHPVREDSLDLYAIRDDCYPPADETDAATARKLHPEFGQAFQPFPGQQPPVNFPQTAYQDYQAYQTLASTSRSPYQPQFQTVQPANPNFAHYPYGQEPGLLQPTCQSHQPVPTHHTAVYETGFAQEDPTGSQQHYTNLNSVQPINAVVQQMGKLEPFSELLAGRYSYYGDPEPQPVPVAAYHNSPPIAKLETDLPGDEQQPDGPDDCDENFGEIIKKSMVETVSA